MSFAIVDGVFTMAFDAMGTLTLSVLLLLLGYAIKSKVAFLERFCIPAPVVSGLLFALLNFFCHETGIVVFQLNTDYQSPFMNAFLVTVGLGAGLTMIKKGGKLMLLYWILSGILSISQNLIAVGVSFITGLEPMLGLMAGAIPLIGGHGSAAAFGDTVETLGFSGGKAIAMAAATFGLIAGGLIGGPLARRLIEKHHLKPDPNEAAASYQDMKAEDNTHAEEKATVLGYLKMVTLICVCISLGVSLATWFSNVLDFTMPSYVGAMFVGIVVRNINDAFHVVKIDMERADMFGTVCLNIFLSYALMTMEIWQLAGVAGPMIAILVVESAFIAVYTYFVVFRVMGKGFDAAMMCAGMMGHGMGATPNAMANMGAVTERYGFSRKAYMIVPIVGAFLVEIVSVPNNTIFVNFLK